MVDYQAMGDEITTNIKHENKIVTLNKKTRHVC